MTSVPAPTVHSICVYCGSSTAAPPAHIDLARRLGRALAERRIRLVYGGGRIGLMGACAEACFTAGGEVLGIMPTFLAQREITYEAVPHRMVETMHERKALMFEEADAFLVLPGGIGTLEEVVEMLSWKRLRLHDKPIVLLSEDDYWAPLVALVTHMAEADYARGAPETMASVDTIEAALKACGASA